MNILNSDLENAAQKGIISPEQAKNLWIYLENLRPEQGKFQGMHVLYYFGGVLILSSMSWFLTTAWENGPAIALIAFLFGLMYLVVGNRLWHKENLKIPGGLLITAAVGLTPVFMYGLQKSLGYWPEFNSASYHDYHLWVRGHWLVMELTTIVVGIIALRYYQFGFLTFPIAFTLWYMSMDLTPVIFGRDGYGYEDRQLVSIWFGLAVLICSYLVDKKFKKIDFAFWTYFFGVVAFWGGLSSMNSTSELNKFIYMLLNIGFIFVSVFLRRKVFLVFGTFGVLGYISHLAWTVFKDSTALPIVLALAGIFVVYLGVQYQKNKARVESAIERMLPTILMKWRPEERA